MAQTMAKVDDATTGLDPKDNQQTLQQELATELATVVPITTQEDFLRDLCDHACFVYLPAINSLPSTRPYKIVLHSCVHQLIERIVQLVFNTLIYGYQKA